MNAANLTAFFAVACAEAWLYRCQLCGPVTCTQDRALDSPRCWTVLLSVQPSAWEIANSWRVGGLWISAVSPVGSRVPAAVEQWPDGRRENFSSPFPPVNPQYWCQARDRFIVPHIETSSCHTVFLHDYYKMRFCQWWVQKRSEGWCTKKTLKDTVVCDVHWRGKQVNKETGGTVSSEPRGRLWCDK